MDQPAAAADLPTSPAAAPRPSAIRGRIYVLAAVVLWSLSGWFAQNPTFDSWPEQSRGLMLAFWRALFAGLLILPLARPSRLPLRIVPLAICFASMNATYLSSMVMTSAANAIWLQSTVPLWVLLVGVFILKEKVRRPELLLVGFGMTGVGTILFFELQGQGLMGVWLGLVSGIFYAGVVLLLGSMQDQNPPWIISLALLITAALLSPVIFVQNIWPSGQQWLLLAAFGLFQLGLPYILFTHGLRTVSSVEASGITLLEPILVPIWVYLGWGQQPAWWTLVGGGFIFCGLMLRLLVRR